MVWTHQSCQFPVLLRNRVLKVNHSCSCGQGEPVWSKDCLGFDRGVDFDLLIRGRFPICVLEPLLWLSFVSSWIGCSFFYSLSVIDWFSLLRCLLFFITSYFFSCTSTHQNGSTPYQTANPMGAGAAIAQHAIIQPSGQTHQAQQCTTRP